MKKLILLLFIPLVFTCSSDDDNSSDSSIEGRWNLTSQYINGIIQNIDSCSLQSYMLLSEEGSGLYYIHYTDFPENPEIEPCGLDATFNVNSSYITDNTFSMTWDYGGGDIENGAAEIDNNTLTFTSTYDGDNYETIFTKEFISVDSNSSPTITFINGNFENNSSVNCDYNNTDVIFNQKMSNVYAYGASYAESLGGYVGQVDIQTFECYVNPQNGDWCLGLGSNTDYESSDAINIELSRSLIINKTYELTFHVFGNLHFYDSLANIVVGESLNADEFGTLIGTFSPYGDNWKEISVTFSAIQESKYISIKNEIIDGWNQIDNFSINEL